jgi:predicted Zn-dependent protease
VGIYTGILPITKDESGLATVIGHEVAHATARHGGERMTIALASQGVETILNASMSDSKWQAAAATAYGAGSQLLVALPHSRVQEYSADEIGMIYMARAGYDPGAAIEFWKRFSEYNSKQGGETLWFLRTHPLDQDRVNKLQEWLPKARQEFNPNP